MKKITIIIPAHNEEKRIDNTLNEYPLFFKDLKNKKILNFSILVVINNSQDRTEEIVKKYSKKFKEVKYINLKPGGKGFAVIEGFKEALKEDSEMIGFVDADMATDPKSFFDLIENIEDYDAIIASRYIKGAKVYPKQSFQRIFVSRIFNFLIRILFLFPYNDTQCGAKLFKKESIEKILPDLTITKWAFDVDLIYCLKKNRLSVKEHPTNWSDKAYSKINLKRAGPLMALAIIRLRILNSPFKNFIKLYDKMPEFMKMHHRL
ncbi:MAG: glycosyltransferase [Candidatus Nanoarchaeia archaeon]|nr:glycosyltransferase [Candidatus Nanoarchaeia archaeon]